jgi:Fe2+ or Zn2+ uptake regulation protein
MPRYTVSREILKHLLKTKCSDYDSLKKILEENGINPEGIYAYVAQLKKSGLVNVIKIATVTSRKVYKGVVCINESRVADILMLLSRGAQNEPKH